MKPASAGLIAHLNSNTKFDIADLYTLTLRDGTVFRWADYDQDITIAPNTWSASGPLRGGVSRPPAAFW